MNVGVVALLRATGQLRGRNRAANLFAQVGREWQIYLLLSPMVMYLVIFVYFPMYGVQIAFKNFTPALGIMGSPWAGYKHFVRLVNSPSFQEIIRNSIVINVYTLLVNTPLPIALALMLNYQTRPGFKRLVQTVSYAPYFISTVVLVGMLKLFLSPRVGVINKLLELVGVVPVNFLAEPGLFYSIFVWSGTWQKLGWMAIIYIGALTNINPELHEAGIVDGATIMQRIRHIDLPGIMSVIVVQLLLNTGGMLSVGFEKIYLMQNPLNLSVSEVISTYTYKAGLLNAQYSFSAAVDLFNSLVNFSILLAVNTVVRKISEHSLF
ncbi:MAG TPA: ABC transporter permease subunit [Clostridia bacterium]|nr:ABC transporter permease subunit [Clostridia bacterium]